MMEHTGSVPRIDIVPRDKRLFDAVWQPTGSRVYCLPHALLARRNNSAAESHTVPMAATTHPILCTRHLVPYCEPHAASPLSIGFS